jgi:hypothetical protein
MPIFSSLGTEPAQPSHLTLRTRHHRCCTLLLQAGVVAAFGLVRGLGQATGILTAGAASSSSSSFAGLDLSQAALGSAGLALGQCMLAAAFAAMAVEAAFQRGLVLPFGAASADSDSSSNGSSGSRN